MKSESMKKIRKVVGRNLFRGFSVIVWPIWTVFEWWITDKGIIQCGREMWNLLHFKE